MLLERAGAPFADPGWLYQVKWDGVRNLTLVEGGRVRHWSRRLRERTGLFPEFDGLARAVTRRRLVLDGEIVVLRDGRPSFAAVLERDLAASPPAHGLPATLMLFDLLEVDGEELYSRPLQERLALLAEVVPPSEAWQVVASFPGRDGPALFEAAVSQGLEGVVAKRLGSRYAPGTRSRDWLKVKRRSEMLAVVVGYTNPAGRPGGLLLGPITRGGCATSAGSARGCPAPTWPRSEAIFRPRRAPSSGCPACGTDSAATPARWSGWSPG